MKIVLIGANDVGFYIAKLLSKENHHVIYVDKDAKKLEFIASKLKIETQVASGRDLLVLEALNTPSCDLFLALDSDDNLNLVSCQLAKELGFTKTVACIQDSQFLNQVRLDMGRTFGVDHFINPSLLVANEIYKYIIRPGSLRVESFAHGAILLRTILIPHKWKRSDQTLKELKLPSHVIVGLIKRNVFSKETQEEEIIFPHGNAQILPGDEVTFIGNMDAISDIHRYFGISDIPIQSALIMGGSQTAYELAKILEKNKIDVSQQVHKTTNNELDLDFLIDEKVFERDVFISCEKEDEVNLTGALLVKDAGCENTVIQLSNPSYEPIAKRLRISHVSSPPQAAGNQILTYLYSKMLTSLVTFYDNRAEILEIRVSMRAKITGIPLSELGPLLPSDFLIVVIQNRGRIMIATGDRIISPGDSVIVVTHPKHIKELDTIF